MRRIIQFFLVFPFLLHGQIVLDNEYAFHGAVGYGRNATVGQPARTIYKVTNLNASGPGSFADAVSASNRDVIFDVAGTITVPNINSSAPNIVIHGQTAYRNGGQGITLKTDGTTGAQVLYMSGDHVAIRHVRIRRGTGPVNESSGDCLNVTGSNVILDHVSVSWGTDENIGGQTTKNFTMQHCISSEALYLSTHIYTNDSNHDEYQTGHSKGALWGNANDKLTIYNSIFSHNDGRNPQIVSDGRFELVNVISALNQAYHIGSLKGITANGAEFNVVKCLTVPGAGYKNGRHEIHTSDHSTAKFYLQGNIGHKRTSDSQSEWDAIGNNTSDIPTSAQATTPFTTNMSGDYAALPDANELLSADNMAQMGAYLFRDSVDETIIDEIINGGNTTALNVSDAAGYDGPNYVGQATYYDFVNSVTEAGGWPTLSGMSSVPVDVDNDGIEDNFEVAHGISDATATKVNWTFGDVTITNNAGYTNFQMYMMFLAGDFGGQGETNSNNEEEFFNLIIDH
ncbi:MAG: hypothetical protein AB3N16_07985 [Flavobacteriaceae bacterium]